MYMYNIVCFNSASTSDFSGTANLNMLRPISMDDLNASVNKMKASKVFAANQPRF